jgi:hypothetical protein
VPGGPGGAAQGRLHRDHAAEERDELRPHQADLEGERVAVES